MTQYSCSEHDASDASCLPPFNHHPWSGARLAAAQRHARWLVAASVAGIVLGPWAWPVAMTWCKLRDVSDSAGTIHGLVALFAFSILVPLASYLFLRATFYRKRGCDSCAPEQVDEIAMACRLSPDVRNAFAAQRDSGGKMTYRDWVACDCWMQPAGNAHGSTGTEAFFTWFR